MFVEVLCVCGRFKRFCVFVEVFTGSVCLWRFLLFLEVLCVCGSF